jgi:hypothetical protein
MAVINDYFCRECERVEFDCWDAPTCCGEMMSVALSAVYTPEWGSPQYHPHLREEPFKSRDELKSWARENGMGLGVSSEKVGGARNEDHLNLGKKFSYQGSPKS